ncbi:MAG: hypothetical protein AB8B80_06625 [Marinicellaceae bacterium]
MKIKILSIILITTIVYSCGLKKKFKSKLDFLNNLGQYCGQTFEGQTVFPDDPSDDFAGKKLVMHIKECSENEIRVPFAVGENTSRTWIISRTNKGLLLKHDHRHADGTPDELTMYGGFEDKNLTTTNMKASFAADEETAEMLPEAKTNVWTLTIDKENNQFIYSLKRHDKPRYEAVFSMKSNSTTMD